MLVRRNSCGGPSVKATSRMDGQALQGLTNVSQIAFGVIDEVGADREPDVLLSPAQMILKHKPRNLAPLADTSAITCSIQRGSALFLGCCGFTTAERSPMKKPALERLPSWRLLLSVFSCCWAA